MCVMKQTNAHAQNVLTLRSNRRTQCACVEHTSKGISVAAQSEQSSVAL